MFLGKFSRPLDTTSRFSVPTSFKAPLAERAYVTRGFDQNLQVLTRQAFEEIYRSLSQLNIADPLARSLLRLVLGTAQELSMDDSGQLTIPEELKEFANLHDSIFVIGQGEYFEVWSPELWDKQEAQLRDAEANASRFAALTITAG